MKNHLYHGIGYSFDDVQPQAPVEPADAFLRKDLREERSLRNAPETLQK